MTIRCLALLCAIQGWTLAALAQTKNAGPAESGSVAATVPRGSAQSPLRKLREAVPSAAPADAIPGKIVRYSEQLVRKYDQNGDGRLRGAELTSLPESLRVSDFDRDGAITTDEFARRIMAYSRRRSLRVAALNSPGSGEAASTAAQGASAAGTDSTTTTANAHSGTSKEAPEKGPQTKRYFVRAGRLPAGLPTWFAECDEDGDAQVTLAEFTRHAAMEDMGQFPLYDRDGDGVIIASEAIAASSANKKSDATAAQNSGEPAAGAPNAATTP